MYVSPQSNSNTDVIYCTVMYFIVSKTPISRAPIYCKPRFTTAISFPQIVLNIYNVNKQNLDLPQTSIYRKPRFTTAISFPQIVLNIYNVNKQNLDLPQTSIYRKPRFTTAISFPQIVLNIYNVNKQNLDLPQTPIYRDCFLSQNSALLRGFTA